MTTSLRDKLSIGKTCHMCWNTIADAQLAGVLAQQGFDGIVLDAQHGLYNEASLPNAIAQVNMAGKAALVRPPVERWDFCQRALDFGAHAIIMPMINNGEDATKFAQMAKYPPIGERSYGPTYAAAMHGLSSTDYVTGANDVTLALAQIETVEAYHNLDEILDVEGIDGILMGPSDFSISARQNPVPDAYGPDTADMVADIAKRTNAKGKVAAAFAIDTKHSKFVETAGYQLIAVGFDTRLISDGAKAVLDAL